MRIFGHLGTSEEIAFKLQTYGIPIDSGPLQIDGTWSLSFHKEYLENLRISEDNEWQQDLCNIQPMELVVPNNKDVLLGRSTKAVSHVGNQQLHHLVEDHFEAYSAATKVQKTEIAWKLVDFIQKTGGRFLKNVEELGWMEVTDLEARDKISHSFRHYRSKIQKKESGVRALKKRMLEKDDCE